MKSSLLALALILLACALYAAWSRPPQTTDTSMPASPSRPAPGETAAGTPGLRPPPGGRSAGTPLAGPALQAALDILSHEVEQMKGTDRRGGYGEHLDPPLEQALDNLSRPESLAQLSDAQAHRLAEMSVALLSDGWALSDHRQVDGGADLVRNHAVLLLENLAGRGYGNLLHAGGDLPPGKQAVDEDAKAVAAWHDWWKQARVTTWTRWREIP